MSEASNYTLDYLLETPMLKGISDTVSLSSQEQTRSEYTISGVSVIGGRYEYERGFSSGDVFNINDAYMNRCVFIGDFQINVNEGSMLDYCALSDCTVTLTGMMMDCTIQGSNVVLEMNKGFFATSNAVPTIFSVVSNANKGTLIFNTCTEKYDALKSVIANYWLDANTYQERGIHKIIKNAANNSLDDFNSSISVYWDCWEDSRVNLGSVTLGNDLYIDTYVSYYSDSMRLRKGYTLYKDDDDLYVVVRSEQSLVTASAKQDEGANTATVSWEAYDGATGYLVLVDGESYILRQNGKVYEIYKVAGTSPDTCTTFSNLEVEGQSLGTVSTTSEDLAISVSCSELGSHDYMVCALNYASVNTGSLISNSRQQTFDLKDQVGPTGGTISTNYSNGTVTITASGFTDDFGTVANCKFYFNGSVLDGYYTFDSKGKAQAVVTLPDTYSYVSATCGVVVYDSANNASEMLTATQVVPDVEAPDAPDAATFTATQGVGGYDVTLSWDAPEDNVAVTYYKVYLDGTNTGSKTNTNSFVCQNLSVGSHKITIEAYDAANNASQASNEFTFQVQDVTAPDKGGISVTMNGMEATIKATNFKDNVGITKYVFSIAGEEKELAYTLDDKGTATAVTTLEDQQIGTISFSVYAQDAAGHKSAASSTTVKVADCLAPDAPSNLAANTDYANRKATFSWDVPYDNSGTIAYYMVYLDGSTTGKKTTTNSYEASSLTGKDHYFMVQAYDLSGNASDLSAKCDFVMQDVTKPSAGIVNAVLSDSGLQVTITLSGFTDDSGSIDHYIFYANEQEISLGYSEDEQGVVTAIYQVDGEFVKNVKFAACAVDAAGNMSSKASAASIYIEDTWAPSVPQNLVATMCNSNTYLLSWDAATDNSGSIWKYDVYINGSLYASVTDTSVTVSKLGGRTYSFAVLAKDDSGNTSALSEACEFQVEDTTAPTTGQISASLSEDSATIKLSVSNFNDDSGSIAKYVFYANDDELDLNYVDNDGYVTAEMPVTDKYAGNVTFKVVAYDAAQHASQPASCSLEVPDTLGPQAPENLAFERTDVNEGLLKWDVPFDNSGVINYYKVFLDGSQYGIVTATNSLSVDALGGGAHSFTVKAFDGAGNEGTMSDTFQFDVSDETPPVAGHISAELINDGKNVALLVYGFSDDSGSIDHYKFYALGRELNIDYWENDLGYIEAVLPLSGDYVGKVFFSVEAVDKGGNISDPASTSLNIPDTQAPDAPDGLAADTSVSGTVTLSWNVPEDNSGSIKNYVVYVDGSATGQKSTTTHITLTKVKPGEHNFYVVAYDNAGNASANSETLQYAVPDVNAPTGGRLTITYARGNADLTLTAKGFTDDSGSIADYHFYANGKLINLDYTIDQAGNAVLVIPVKDEYQGTVKFGATALDAAGNESNLVTAIITLQDVMPPEKPENLTAHATGDYTATLSWDVPYDNSGSIKYYLVYLDDNARASKVTENSFNATSLTGGTHTFRVQAYDAAGNASQISEAFEFEMQDVTAPTPGTITAAVSADASNVLLTLKNFKDDSGSIADYLFYVNYTQVDMDWTTDAAGNVLANYTLDNTWVGNVVFGAKAVDAAGNESKLATTKVRIEDTMPPTTPTDLNAQITGKDTATLSWTASQDNSGSVAYYVVYLDGSDKGLKTTATSLSLTKQKCGTHTFKVQAFDAAGNASDISNETSFEFDDVTAPTAGRLTSTLNSQSGIVTLNATGFKDDSGSIEKFLFYVNDEYVDLEYNDANSANVIAYYNLEEDFAGTLKFGVQAVDAADNASKVVVSTLSIKDTIPPSAPTGLACEMLNKSTAMLTWNPASDNSGSIKYYMVYVDGSTRGIKSNSCSYNAAKLSGGNHSFTVEAVDAAGNVSSKSDVCSFVVEDITAPTAGRLTVTLAADKRTVNITVTGFKDDSGVIDEYVFYLNGEQRHIGYVESSSGTVTAQDTLDDTQVGILTYSVKALDAAGNESKTVTANLKVTDTVAPDAPYGLQVNVTGNSTATFSWEEPYDNSGSIKYYMVYLDGATKGTKVNTNTFNATKLSCGTHYYTLQAYDAAGNASQISQKCEFDIDDVTAPTTGKVSAKLNSKNHLIAIAVSGFKDDSGTISNYYFSINGKYVSLDYKVTSKGVLSAVYDCGEDYVGSIKISVMAVDASGNISKPATTTVKVADTMAPQAPSGLEAEISSANTVKLSWDVPYDNSGSVSSYLIYIDDSKQALKSTKPYISQSNLTPGVHTFKVAAIDAAKNVSEYSDVCEFQVYDVTAPTGGSIYVKQDSDSNQVLLTARNFRDDSGSIDDFNFFMDGVEITLDDFNYENGIATGTYTTDKVGNTVFGVTALDAAGNESKLVKTSIKLASRA